MSMIGKFVQVEPAQFKQLLSDPESVTELFMEQAGSMEKLAGVSAAMQERAKRLAPGVLAASLDRLPPGIRQQMIERLQKLGVSLDDLKTGKGMDTLLNAMKAGQSALSAAAAAGARGGANRVSESLSLEKDWHALHYLLCGKAEPDATLASQIIMGGTEIGEDDLGYGPARYFDAKQVAAIATELSRADLESEARARFDPAQMASLGLYPGGWDAGELDNLIEQFHRLREFFAEASAKGRIVLTCLT